MSIVFVGLLDFNYIDHLSTIFNIKIINGWIQNKSFRCFNFCNGILAKLKKGRSGYAINGCKGINNITCTIPKCSFWCGDILSGCNLISYAFKILFFINWSIKRSIIGFTCFDIGKHFSILFDIYLSLLGGIVKVHKDLGCCTIHIDWYFSIA